MNESGSDVYLPGSGVVGSFIVLYAIILLHDAILNNPSGIYEDQFYNREEIALATHLSIIAKLANSIEYTMLARGR